MQCSLEKKKNLEDPYLRRCTYFEKLKQLIKIALAIGSHLTSEVQ